MHPLRHPPVVSVRIFPVLAITLFSLLLPTVPARAEGSGSIVGQVVPAHDHALTLATATLPDLGLETKVGDEGLFRFEGIRPGAYVLVVRVPTLGVAVEQVEVRPGEETRIEVELTPNSHFEEIVVSASAEIRDPLDLANPTTRLSGQELALRQEASLGETLAQEPGIHSTFFGPAASRPVIRGLGGDRVRVLEGGLGTGDASALSADHAVATDPAQAERIEVLRGPATLLYGSSAIGGAVNIIDERIPSHRASGAISGRLGTRVGSVADERGGNLTLEGGAGDWAWHLDASRRVSDDYEIPGFAFLEAEDTHDDDPDDDHAEDGNPSGFVPNSDLETRGARFGLSRFFGDKGYFGVAFGGLESEYGLPGGLGHGEAEADHGAEAVRIDMEQRRVDLRGEIREPFGVFQGLRLRLGATDYEHAELEGDEVGTRFFNDFLETRIELVQKHRTFGDGGAHGGSLGLQYWDRDLEAVGDEAFIPRTTSERWAVFTLQEVEMGKLTWQFGARFESQDITVGGGLPFRSHDGLSASLGVVRDLGSVWSVAASLARSVKLPAAEELYANGPHIASQAFEIGDPDLSEEVGLGIDLSLRKQTGRLTGEITFFRQDFDDFIVQGFTGIVDDGLNVLQYRQADAELSGVELEARIELLDRDGRHLHLQLMGDRVTGELAGGENLPRIPPLRLGAGLHFHSERWSATSEVRWIDGQNDVAPNETPTDGYTLLNASLGYRLLLKNRIVDILLRGRNLGDEEARSHTSLLKNVAPLPGRDISLSVALLF